MLNGQALINKINEDLTITKTVGLISDTHVPKRAKYIPRKVFETFRKVDYIVHAGDLVDLSVIDELERIAPVLAVQGNMDGLEITSVLPIFNMLKILDWKIGIIHDRNKLHGYKKMNKTTDETSFNVLVYGHTHLACAKWEGKILYVNPGSPTDSRSLMYKHTVGLLEITMKSITPRIINL